MGWASISSIKDPATRLALQTFADKLDQDKAQTWLGITLTGLTANQLVQTDADKALASVADLTTFISGTANQISVTDNVGSVTLAITNPLAVPGKVTAGSFGSPLDVGATRKYGFELHYSGNDYDVTGIRSRASLITTADSSTRTACGAELQAANSDGISVNVLNGALIEAIGKSTANAATISTMRGALIGAEWSAKDTVTDLRTLHVRTHTRDAATEGYFSNSGYGIYLENEAVGGNGQALTAGIYFKGTNLSAGNKAFAYGIDFSGATFGTAEIKLSNGETIDNLADGVIKLSGGGLWMDGTTGSTPTSGAGTRLMWIPLYAAFRCGYVDSTQWDAANLGAYSFATGYKVTASGDWSTALGFGSTASGNYSIASGDYPAASGIGSVALGYNYDGNATSFVAGTGTPGQGYGQIAMGYASTGNTLKAEGTGSVAMGQDVNSLTQANCLVFGRGFTADSADTFNIGFGQLDYLFTSTLANFHDSNILTSGTLGAGVATLATGSTIGTLTLADGSITDSGGAIDFGDETLTTLGRITKEAHADCTASYPADLEVLSDATHTTANQYGTVVDLASDMSSGVFFGAGGFFNSTAGTRTTSTSIFGIQGAIQSAIVPNAFVDFIFEGLRYTVLNDVNVDGGENYPSYKIKGLNVQATMGSGGKTIEGNLFPCQLYGAQIKAVLAGTFDATYLGTADEYGDAYGMYLELQNSSIETDGDIHCYTLYLKSAASAVGAGNNWALYSPDAVNSAFAGNVRIGSTTAPTVALDVTGSAILTGFLQLTQKAGTTTDGDLWNDSTQEALQTFVSGIEQTLVGVIFTQTADKTIANTTTETTMFGTGVGTLVLPANFWTVGKTIRVEIHGDFADTGNPTAQIRVKLDAVELSDSTAITLSGLGGTEEWECVVIITCRSVGGSGTVETVVDWEYETTTGSSAIERLDIGGTLQTVDTTQSDTLDITFAWGTAHADNTLISEVAFVEVLN